MTTPKLAALIGTMLATTSLLESLPMPAIGAPARTTAPTISWTPTVVMQSILGQLQGMVFRMPWGKLWEMTARLSERRALPPPDDNEHLGERDTAGHRTTAMWKRQRCAARSGTVNA
jgi:hypothetical protein